MQGAEVKGHSSTGGSTKFEGDCRQFQKPNKEEQTVCLQTVTSESKHICLQSVGEEDEINSIINSLVVLGYQGIASIHTHTHTPRHDTYKYISAQTLSAEHASTYSNIHKKHTLGLTHIKYFAVSSRICVINVITAVQL